MMPRKSSLLQVVSEAAQDGLIMAWLLAEARWHAEQLKEAANDVAEILEEDPKTTTELLANVQGAGLLLRAAIKKARG